MANVRVTETIACPPDEFFEFVMDTERYAEVDKRSARSPGSAARASRWSLLADLRLLGCPTHGRPAVAPDPRREHRFSLLPPPHNRLAHATAHFEASFECTPIAGGTQVTRTLEFRFTPALRWILEPLLRRRLPGQVRDEIQRAKQHLESAPST